MARSDSSRRQVSDPTDEFAGETSTGVDARLSALLCYLAWWVSGIVFLVIEQRHEAVRFHAAQSIVLFGGLSVVIFLMAMASFGMLFVSPEAFQAAYTLSFLLSLASVALWLFVMLRIFKGESWHVPFAGDFAARLARR
jgi:uncharacterized membrane protein